MPATNSELLQRHQPSLLYDGQEAYFADSAAEWTDAPTNQLLRKDRRTVVAAAKPEGGAAKLSLDLLSAADYGSPRAPWEDGDYIGFTADRGQYPAIYRDLHTDTRYRNRVYGRAVADDQGETRWLQYWFFYFFNDAPASHIGIGYGKHEGDWEMVQIRLGEDQRPDLAVYAQHKHAEVREWRDVAKTGSGSNPIIYVARASHAAYFEPIFLPWERADGKLPAPPLVLEDLTDHLPGWALWRGAWGDTIPDEVLGHTVGERSPGGPCCHKQWDEPDALLEDKAPQAVPAAALSELPKLPAVDVTRDAGGGARVAYAFPGGDRGGASHLLVTLTSTDDKDPPVTKALPLEDGKTTSSVDLGAFAPDDSKRYTVRVSAMNGDGSTTASVARTLMPTGGAA